MMVFQDELVSDTETLPATRIGLARSSSSSEPVRALGGICISVGVRSDFLLLSPGLLGRGKGGGMSRFSCRLLISSLAIRVMLVLAHVPQMCQLG